LKIFYFAVFIASTADIFDGIAKMEVQSLISDEVPNLNGSSLVVGGSCEVTVGHFLTRLDTVLQRVKFWRCKAMKIVITSSNFVSGLRSAFSICLSLNCCSIVSSNTGAGSPKSWFLIGEIIVITL
jgi:hypothetical protein